MKFVFCSYFNFVFCHMGFILCELFFNFKIIVFSKKFFCNFCRKCDMVRIRCYWNSHFACIRNFIVIDFVILFSRIFIL